MQNIEDLIALLRLLTGVGDGQAGNRDVHRAMVNVDQRWPVARLLPVVAAVR